MYVKRSVLLVAVLVALLFPWPAMAVCNGLLDRSVMPFAFETITVSTASIGFTAGTAFPSGDIPSVMAIATTETNSLRFRADGLAPSATVGHLVTAGQTIEVCGTQAMRTFRMIRASADATVSVSFYRAGP